MWGSLKELLKRAMLLVIAFCKNIMGKISFDVGLRMFEHCSSPSACRYFTEHYNFVILEV